MAKSANKGKNPGRVVQDDEARLFEAAMREVKPLAGRGGEAPDGTGAKAAPKPDVGIIDLAGSSSEEDSEDEQPPERAARTPRHDISAVPDAHVAARRVAV